MSMRHRPRTFATLAVLAAPCGLAALLVATTACTTSTGVSDATLAPLGSLVTPTFITLPPPTTAPASTFPVLPIAPSTSFLTGPGGIPTTTTIDPDLTYTVKANDTVLGIARKYDITGEQLAAYNGWADGPTHSIFPGDKVRIPPKDAPTTTVPSGGGGGGPVATTTTTANGAKTYTVKANDTVFGIARKFGITADVLASYNNWSDGSEHHIFPGDVIDIPPA